MIGRLVEAIWEALGEVRIVFVFVFWFVFWFWFWFWFVFRFWASITFWVWADDKDVVGEDEVEEGEDFLEGSEESVGSEFLMVSRTAEDPRERDRWWAFFFFLPSSTLTDALLASPGLPWPPEELREGEGMVSGSGEG